jgi:putative Ca2+/H+ antiporter (TMEM165/GDT1 family)
MEAFIISMLVVAVGEIGDKTQLLALLLAARFRRPVPIILGILCATITNHAIAGAIGQWVHGAVSPTVLRWGLGISFMAIAVWALVPDKMEKDQVLHGRYGVFCITLIAFFLAEIGDKTQIATIVLAAKYNALVAVVSGTTLGMLLADVPAVLLGHAASRAIPFKAVRLAAAGLFGALGLVVMLGMGPV